MTATGPCEVLDRERLIQDLEAAVVAGPEWDDGLRARLGRWAQREDGSQPVVTEGLIDQVAAEGLKVLGDQQLLAVANSFELLQAIQERVVETVAPVWIDVFDRLSSPDFEADDDDLELGALPELGWRRFLEGRSSEVDLVDSELHLSSQVQRACQALGERRIHEGCAVSRIAALPEEEWRRAIEWLRVIVDRMRVMDGKYFLALDEEFHRWLGQFSDAPREILHDAISFITMHGQRTIDDEAVRAGICAEHDAIIEQLACRDDEAAFERVVEHLRKAQLRWFPTLVADIQRVNRSFFESLNADCALWYLSPNVMPVEAVPQNYESTGRAAAAAVERGATLLYVTWSDALLLEEQQHGVAIRRNEADVREGIAKFRQWVARQLTTSTRSAEEAQRIAAERIVHFTIDLETRFAYVNRCFGYFRQPDGDGLLTHREDIRNPYEDQQVLERFEESSVDTWLKIDQSTKSFNENREFAWTIDKILRHIAGGGEPDAQVAARLHARWYSTHKACAGPQNVTAGGSKQT